LNLLKSHRVDPSSAAVRIGELILPLNDTFSSFVNKRKLHTIFIRSVIRPAQLEVGARKPPAVEQCINRRAMKERYEHINSK